MDRLLTMHLGPDEILVNMDLVVNPGLSEAEGEAVVRRVEEEIRRQVPAATRVFIELGRGAEAGGLSGAAAAPRRLRLSRPVATVTMPQRRPAASTTGTGAPSRKAARPATSVEGVLGHGRRPGPP